MTEPTPPAKRERVPSAYADDALRAWARKTPGADYNRAAARLDDLLKPIDRALGLGEWNKLIDQVKDELETALAASGVAVGNGPTLFAEVVERIRAHFYFEEEWHYTICALFVFQAWVVRAGALPATFYLYFGGAFSTGKSNILSLVASLTDGLMFENVSPPALARVIEKGRTVLLDEIDVQRGQELDDVMSALLRSGYRRNGPPYVRWDAKEKKAEIIPVFGPKSGTYRSTLDPALQSRGFVIPTAKPIGEESYALVLANLWSKTGDLIPRLRAWGKTVAKKWDPETLEALANTPGFQAEVRKVAGRLGANRESELLTIALLVARMIPVDVSVQLSSAKELRNLEVSEDQAEALEELRDVVLSIMSRTVTFAADGHEVYRVVQRGVRDAINLRHKDRQEKPITNSRLVLLRREFGVKDSWLVEPGHSVAWNLPKAFVDSIAPKPLEEAKVSPPPGGPLQAPYPPSVTQSNPLPPFVPPSVTKGYSNVSGEGGGGGHGGTKGAISGGGGSETPVEPPSLPPSDAAPALEESENWTVPRSSRKLPPVPTPESVTQGNFPETGPVPPSDPPSLTKGNRVAEATAALQAFLRDRSGGAEISHCFDHLRSQSYTDSEAERAVARVSADGSVRLVGDLLVPKPGGGP